MPQSSVRPCRGAVTPSKNAGSQSRRPRFRRQRLDADCLTPLYPSLPDTALAVGCSPGQAESPVPTPQSQEFGWIALRAGHIRVAPSRCIPCGTSWRGADLQARCPSVGYVGAAVYLRLSLCPVSFKAPSVRCTGRYQFGQQLYGFGPFGRLTASQGLVIVLVGFAEVSGCRLGVMHLGLDFVLL